MKEQILLFELNDETQKRLLRQTLMPLRIRMKVISRGQYKMTLGELTAADSDDSNPTGNADRIPAPMLVFCGLTSARLDAVLQAMRRNKIRIPHKAVLTPHNAAWTPEQLFEALEEERKQFESK